MKIQIIAFRNGALMKVRAFLSGLFFFAAFFSLPVLAQTGFPPFGSFQDGGFDSVNLQDLNANFMIPVVSHPGRGLQFQYALGYNSLLWLRTAGSSPAWKMASGWTTAGPVGFLSWQRTQLACPTTPDTIDTNFVFTDPMGTQHPVNLIVYVSGPCQLANGTAAYASDASGFFIDAKRRIVYAPDGTKFTFGGTTTTDGNGNFVQDTPTVTDPNGNQLTGVTNLTTQETDWTDTLQQTALKITKLFNGPNGQLSETDYKRLAVDGTYQQFSVKYEFVNVQSNFGCSGVTEFSGTNFPLVSEIDLPNGQRYTFAYEPTPGFAGSFTGRIQQITLPTGGTITYQYTGPNDGISCTDGTGVGLTRTINDGTTSSVWVYSRDTSALTTTVTAPKLSYDAAANQTVVAFDSKGHETSRKIYQGSASGSPIRTVNTNWASNNTPASRTVILEDGATQSEVETTYDSNGILHSMTEHDWGQAAPGTILRTTTLGYLSGSAYSAINMINRLQDKTVADSEFVVRYRVHIDYDQPGGAGQGQINATCITDAPQQDPNYGCSYTTRGLPTTVTTYTDAATPSGAIAKTFKYDSLGNLISAQLNCCQQKAWNFSPDTKYAFPDSVISGSSGGTQLQTSATYYLTTGQIKTSTDENLQITTYSYADPGHLDRLTDMQRPDLAHMTTTYNDVGLTVINASPVQGTDVVKSLTAFDGLGRPITQTTEDAGNNVSSISDTQYDVLGRPYKTSNPHTGAAQFWTTNQFDALGRPTITILPDGVQAISSYLLNSATATDPAGKQRRSFIDGLGRLKIVNEPGDSFSGAQAQGSILINGTLGSIPGSAGTPGTGTVTINGAEKSKTTNPCLPAHQNCPVTIYDSGTISVTVNGVQSSAPYGQGSNTTLLASALADAVNKNTNAPVTATSSGNVVTLQAKSNGSQTDYSLTAAATTSNPSTFPLGSFSTAVSGSTLSGGTDPTNPINDSGSIVLKVGGFTSPSVCYGTTCNSTATAVASALATALRNAPGTPVQAVSVSGSTISMTYSQIGAAGNVPVTAAPTSNDSAHFPNGSFASEGGLSGGADPYPSSLAHPYVTTYEYGVLDNLRLVAQGAQIRSYDYDGMGRLTDVTTPEAGHANLQYNSFDLVTKRTDARNVVTNYSYDTLNRLHEIDYDVSSAPGVPATPSVIYSYGTDPTQNNNGRITSVTDGLGSENYTYDQLGRVKQLQKVINGTPYPIAYGYNLAGELTSLTYPSGRVVQQSFDGIGRLCEIAPQTSGCGTATAPYAKQFGYNSAFQTTGFTYGNGVIAAFNFSSDRLQLTNLSYTKGTQTLFGLNYYYKQDATNCPSAPTGNNGQIQCVTDLVDSGRNASYSYDTLGRLSAAVTKGSTAYPQWGLSFSMDSYGNLTGQTTTAGSAPQFSVAVNAANNQISTLAYDPSGNLLNDGTNALVYDAENRTVSSTRAGAASTYSYDCKSLRVQKISGGVTTVYIFSGSKVIAEYENGAAPNAPKREYIYSGSNMLAKVEAGATTYYHRDHLSNRIVSDANGTTIGQQGQFPYGQSWYDSNATKWKFTTYERDSESGNDYAMARYYASSLGRFTSPDIASGSTESPQSLNRYTYVNNDPVNLTDPSGQFLTALTLFLDRAGFPNAWANFNEFDLMNIPVRIGTAYLWHSDSASFHFENFDHSDLMNFGQQGELQLFGTYPIYGSAILDPPVSGSGPNPDRLTQNKQVINILYCLLKRGGFGFKQTERSTWITENNNSFSEVQWPWSAAANHDTWKGPVPSSATALAHTHPSNMDPKPSTGGEKTDDVAANTTGLPNYVVTRDAIWKQVPHQKDPAQVAGSDWWKDSEKDEKKGLFKCK